jgi:hypothetical protein
MKSHIISGGTTTHMDQSEHLSHKLVAVCRRRAAIAIRVTVVAYSFDDRRDRCTVSLRRGGWDRHLGVGSVRGGL